MFCQNLQQLDEVNKTVSNGGCPFYVTCMYLQYYMASTFKKFRTKDYLTEITPNNNDENIDKDRCTQAYVMSYSRETCSPMRSTCVIQY